MKKDESFLNVVPMPHTLGETFREALSEIPEKTDQELYFPEEESQNETPEIVDEPGNEEPGNNEPGNEEPGNVEPGTNEPGNEEPGNVEP